jgi:hypothetical protein
MVHLFLRNPGDDRETADGEQAEAAASENLKVIRLAL